MKAVGIKGTCPRCGEEVEVLLSKKQVKALYKAFKFSNPSLAEIDVERSLGRDKMGNLKC